MVSPFGVMKRFLFALVLLAPTLLVRAESLPPFLHDPSVVGDAVLERVTKPALAAKIVTIVDKKTFSPSGDAHDYISYGRYWWPNPAKPAGLPFIRRDGHPNDEQIALGDRSRLDTMVNTVATLAVAWHRWHREDHASRAGDWLRTWFITPATRMKPALEFAQIRLGHEDNRGSPAGVLEGRVLADLVDALRLLHDSPAWRGGEEATVRQWFADYSNWLQTAKLARDEHAAPNNHGSWFLVQAAMIARYLGRDDEAKRLCEEDLVLIGAQFRRDGSQPLELEREDGLGYSLFNLQAQLQLARLARPLGIELWNYTAPNGGSLKKGLDYLRPYNKAPENWPHQQIEKLKPGFLTAVLKDAEALDKTAAKP